MGKLVLRIPAQSFVLRDIAAEDFNAADTDDLLDENDYLISDLLSSVDHYLAWEEN